MFSSHKASVWIIAGKTSEVTFIFQITDQNAMDSFRLCAFALCPRDNICQIEMKRGRSLATLHLTTLQSLVVFNEKNLPAMFTFHIVIQKWRRLLINTTQYQNIFDGPTINSQRTFITDVNSIKTMSSFQATIVLFQTLMRFQNNPFDQIQYSSMQLVSLISNATSISFNNGCLNGTVCVIHEVLLLQTPPKYFLNISVHEMSYDGPKEAVYPVTFGGIAIGFLKKNFAGHTVLESSENIPGDSPDSRGNRHPRIEVITEKATKYAALVFYFYSQYSHLKAELKISKTKCVSDRFSMKRYKALSKDTFHFERWLKGSDLQCVILSAVAGGLFSKVYEMTHKTRVQGLFLFFPGESQVEISVYKFAYFARVPRGFVLFDNSVPQYTNTDFSISDNLVVGPGLKTVSTACGNKNVEDVRFLYRSLNIAGQGNVRIRFTTFLAGVTPFAHMQFALSSTTEPEQWVRIKVVLTPCKLRTIYWYVLPVDVLQWEINRHCASKKQTQSQTLTDILETLQYRLVWTKPRETTKPNILKMFANLTKVAFADSEVYLSTPLARPFAGVIIQTQSSLQTNLTLSFSEHKIYIQVPGTTTEIFIPTTMMPYCYFNRGVCSFQAALNVLTPRSTLSFDILSSANITRTKLNVPSHLKLWTVSETFAPKHEGHFVSWNNAHKLCGKKNMTLPSMNSAKDMKVIQQQVYKFQEETSCKKYGNEIIEILYQTAGIFLGLNFQVKLSLPNELFDFVTTAIHIFLFPPLYCISEEEELLGERKSHKHKILGSH